MPEALSSVGQAVFSVTEFLDTANEVLKNMRLTVQGEVTSLTKRGNTVFFSISDPQAPQNSPAKLECVLWMYRYKQLSFKLEEGVEVQLLGQPNIYKPMGKFSFVVDHINPVGAGALQKAFEHLQRKLAAEGYFDVFRKRDLPLYPEKIGVITSKQGDARQDFITHLVPASLTVQLADARVEGLQAVDSLVAAIEWFNQQSQPVEVLVLTRGGGSLESLQAFNSERLAKAIAASKIPVVSAIGHENDVTIADLVADVRASTPTDAGKKVSMGWSQAGSVLERTAESLPALFGRHLERKTYLVERFARTLSSHLDAQFSKFRFEAARFSQAFQTWRYRFEQTQEALKLITTSLIREFSRAASKAQTQLAHEQAQLESADPKRRLKQGYSIVYAGKRLVRSVKKLNPDTSLTIHVFDGSMSARVFETKETS